MHIKSGIKIFNIKDVKRDINDEELKFIRNALEGKRVGTLIIEVNDYDHEELICNISDKIALNDKDLRNQMAPILKEKKIKLLELWTFDFDMFFIKGKDRIVVSEKRENDIIKLEEYCQKHKLTVDDLLYHIVTCEKI